MSKVSSFYFLVRVNNRLFYERKVISMNIRFAFNWRTSPYADTHDTQANNVFIRQQEIYLNDLLKTRGYIYLNTIYETLGIKWDPDRNNVCFRYKPNDTKLHFAIRSLNEYGFDIDIVY